jgi:hypothetical protein
LVYSYNFLSGKWSHLEKKGEVQPDPRASSGMCLQDDHIYIFGGTDGVTKFNDIWSFDIADRVWHLLIRNSQP